MKDEPKISEESNDPYPFIPLILNHLSWLYVRNKPCVSQNKLRLNIGEGFCALNSYTKKEVVHSDNLLYLKSFRL
jgi:hypothetical protein